jgi:F420-non-reducing hydrogenase iron-sulfur subunit
MMDMNTNAKADSDETAAKGRFEPKIVGFLCKWCVGSAIDVGGTAGIQYPPNIRIIKVMCSGSIDPTYVLRALQEGADAVLVAGCPSGNCHYVSGNQKVKRRTEALMTILGTLGVEPERVRVEWIGSEEGQKFAKIATEMTEEIRTLGPNPMSKFASF